MKNDKNWTRFVLLVIFITGTFLLIITPIGANFDEETHVARIWEMSLGHVLPNSLYHKTDMFPSVFFDSSFRRYVNLPVIDWTQWKDQAALKIDFNDYMNYTTRAVYFPTIYAIQAVIIGIMGRLFDFPILFIYYALRLSYLLLYCLFVYLTLRVLPTGRRLFGIIAVIPTAIIQSAAISADAFVFGISFLFTGWILHLLAEPSKSISRKQLIITMILILAVGTLKPNCVFLLLLLFMLPRSLQLTKGQKWALVITSVLSIAISTGWSVVASQFYIERGEPGKNPFAQLLTIFTNPQRFIEVIAASVKSDWLSLLMQSIGVSGYGYYTLPKYIYFIYPILIILAILTEDSKFRLSLRQNLYLAGVGLFNIFMIAVIFFIVETETWADTIFGIQGRYITPLFFLFFSSFLFIPRTRLKSLRFLLTGGIIFISSLTAISLFADYHIPCGDSWFSTKNCVMPRYKNWDESSFTSYTPSTETKLEEIITVRCSNLNAIRLWINDNPGDKDYTYTLSVIGNAGEPVITVDSNGAETTSHGWMTYAFTPVNGVEGKQFFIRISSTFADASQGISFGAFEKDEFTDGYFQVNGNSEGYAPDLVIQYGCVK